MQLLGSPDVSVVAFTSDDYNIYAVGDLLHKKGYNLNTLQNPNAFVSFCTKEENNTQTANVFSKQHFFRNYVKYVKHVIFVKAGC